MKGQKCSVCGYKISAGESILLNIGKVLGEVSKRIPQQQAFGTNTISNITELKCPNCGQVGRWVRDDE